MRIVWFFILLFSILSAKDYALIITIGEYKHISSLVGSHQDNSTYRNILKNWGVNNIVSLEDTEATKENILYHLASISKKIELHDRFYMFFSGHGSSLFDEAYSMKFQAAGLTEVLRDSAAIFPYDFSPKNIEKSVIIGKTDLRPYLEKIDRKVMSGLIVFDACYSEQSIRSHGEKKIPNTTPNILTSSNTYPYVHLIYIASSITEAQSGKFSTVLNDCLEVKFVLEDVKQCINTKMDKSFQIPVVLSNENM